MRASAERVVVALSLGESRVRVAVLDGHLAIESGRGIDLIERDPSSESIVTTILKATEQVLGGHRSGAARGVDDFVAVRLGGSVTTATVAGGRWSVGGTGRAGEIGHLRVEEFGPACVCGLTGCLDSFVSSTA